ncbi:fimbria/pilus periplasmic chaperone [Salmonella enterica subsp. enterica serovar Give]|nr:fimbria/pilus periplasmic chaperone [Salmonella enterica subsp. enterica serovar Give]
MRNYRQWLVFSKVILTLLGLTGWYGPAQAAVNIDRTRIIFASDDIAQSLTLSNDNTTPMLLQVWTDAGNIDASPDNSKTPLVALPPVFKMQPGELRTLRLLLSSRRHCCKVSDEAAFCLIQRPYISKTLLTRRISPRGSP